MSIRWKLLAATAVVGAVAAFIAIVGLKRIRTLNRQLTQTVDFLSTNSRLASLLKQELTMATRAERNMLQARTEDGAKRFAVVVDEVAASIDLRLGELRELVSEEDGQLLDTFAVRWDEWRNNHERLSQVMTRDSNIEARRVSVGKARQAVDRLEESLDRLIQQFRQELDTSRQSSDLRQTVATANKLHLTAEIYNTVLKMQRAEKNLILAPLETEMRGYEKQFKPLIAELEKSISELSTAVGAADGSKSVTEVRKAYEDYLNANQQVRDMVGEPGDLETSHPAYVASARLAAECDALLARLVQKNELRMQEYRHESEQLYATSQSMLLGSSICGILLSVAISFYTGQGVARRLSRLSRGARAIQTTGDLSRPMPDLGSDELGELAESFDKMRQSLYEERLKLKSQTDRLGQLTRTLDTKNKEMQQFVYTVSHDLKSPLVSCKGLLGLLKEDVENKDYDALLDSVNRMDEATDQLNQIIDDLLMLSRIGRKSLDLSEFDVHSLVTTLVAELSDRIGDVEVEVEDSLPMLVADESDVRRVFENLLTNALKYGCRDSGAKIIVGGARNGEENCYFVRDNGPGISPDYHEKIFGLFQRLDTSQPGTGLGLASVAKIMDMHGGRAWVESMEGQGATFWIAFPHLSLSTES